MCNTHIYKNCIPFKPTLIQTVKSHVKHHNSVNSYLVYDKIMFRRKGTN